MNILFFSPYFHPYISGLTVYPYRVLTTLAKKHHFTVITFQLEPQQPLTETIAGLTIIRLPYWFKVSKGFIAPGSLKVFSRLLESTDGLIINLPNAEGLWLTHQAVRRSIPILAIHHCDVVLGPSITQRLISTALQVAVDYQLLAATQVVVNTVDYAQTRHSFNKIQSKSVALYPPMDPKLYSLLVSTVPSSSTKVSSQPLIGFVGRLAAEKGVLALIEAASLLKVKQPKLIFIGPFGANVAGEKHIYQLVKEKLAFSSIDYRFYGQVTIDQLSRLYSQLDVLVLPSQNPTESFGLVQCEAMVAGVPVVVTDMPGVRVPIQHTGMGLIVPPKNPTALASAIDQVFTYRSRYTQNDQINRARKLFNPQTTFSAYDHLITQTFSR